MPRRRSQRAPADSTQVYEHKEHYALARPDVGLQAQFKKKKPPATYRYDPSLDPELSWDINAGRELAERLIEQIRTAETLEEARAAAEQLKRMSSPFLNWAGKAERGELTVPTLPLFVHERLSTKGILEAVRTRKRQLDFFADLEMDITDRILRAYEHETGWVNRLILGDSLVVMNSLLQYEGLGGQVQMIYMDPPYGVKFGSNFQPFIRRRDVRHNADDDFTREPEMVQAYRDTWELGLHSYLTYLRDRLQLARELLHPAGSIFVQISDDNLHHVRELLDEVFGVDNYIGQIVFRKTGSQSVTLVPSNYDYVLHYARQRSGVKFWTLYMPKQAGQEGARQYVWVEAPSGDAYRRMTAEELANPSVISPGWRIFRPGPLTSPGASPNAPNELELGGRVFTPGANRHWSLGVDGTRELASRGRVMVLGNTLCSKLYLNDYPVSPLTNVWADTGGSGFAAKPLYVVQTDTLVIDRCMLMTTDPGDLVLDPTCGSGTTPYVAEQWGRRWIAIDTSRVPLALARQRLLTATFPWYELRDEKAGLSGGFKYERKQNSKGEEVGGIVLHITLKSIAQGEKPKEEILVDRPNVVPGIVRVSGPFVVEATIPTPVDMDLDGEDDSGAGNGDHYARLLEALRRSPVLHLPGNRTVTFKGVRRPARSLALHAEATVEANGEKPVAFVFGPESGAVSEQLVYRALQEAELKSYAHLYVVGFACQDAARKLIDSAQQIMSLGATYVNATMDLAMSDLLKTSRASQVFSVTGAPDVRLTRLKRKSPDGEPLYQVELLGLDVFDAATMETTHLRGDDVPAWFLDTGYNDLCFLVCQAFFPRTGAWDNLKRALKGVYEDGVWEHLAGTVSEPFVAGESGRVAVKVIDDRGNELLVVKSLEGGSV
jgi:adenine-specific DNA-methyltransferase